MYHAPVCEECGIGMFLRTSGITIIDMKDDKPIKLTASDLHECPICEKQIATGHAELGIGEDDKRFDKISARILSSNAPAVFVTRSEQEMKNGTKIPICVPCGKSMYTNRGTAYTLDTFLDPPRIYKIYECSSYKCPECGKKIMDKFLRSGTSHIADGFEQWVGGITRGEYYAICYERIQDAKNSVEIIDIV